MPQHFSFSFPPFFPLLYYLSSSNLPRKAFKISYSEFLSRKRSAAINFSNCSSRIGKTCDTTPTPLQSPLLPLPLPVPGSALVLTLELQREFLAQFVESMRLQRAVAGMPAGIYSDEDQLQVAMNQSCAQQ